MTLPLPIVFTAWGYRSGSVGWEGLLANYCESAGIRSVAVPIGIGGYAAGLPNCLPEEARLLRERGFRVYVWGVADTATILSECARLDAAVPQDWLPQIEGPGQRDLVLQSAAEGIRPSVIISNYSGGGDIPGEAEELREAGVETVLVECYNDAGPIEPYTNLTRMLWQGTHYGWQPEELVACMGTYHNESPDVYTGVEQVGREFGLYLAEPMSVQQWQEFGALNPEPPPEPEPPEDEMEPVTDQQAREAVKIATQGAIQNYTSPKPKGRNTVNWRIANADDTSWNAARDTVVAALDEAGVPPVPD